MFKRLGFHSDDMALALVLWLCSLPLVGILAVPLFGWQVGGLVALVLLVAAMAMCWTACGWKLVSDWKRKESSNDHDQH